MIESLNHQLKNMAKIIRSNRAILPDWINIICARRVSPTLLRCIGAVPGVTTAAGVAGFPRRLAINKTRASSWEELYPAIKKILIAATR